MALSEQEIRDLIAKYGARNKQIAATDEALLDLILAGSGDPALAARVAEIEVRVTRVEDELFAERAARLASDALLTDKLAAERDERIKGDINTHAALNTRLLVVEEQTAALEVQNEHQEGVNVAVDHDLRVVEAQVGVLTARVAALEAGEPEEPPPPPPPPSDFSWTPLSPKVAEPVTFSVIDPLPTASYSWDRTADNVPDVDGTSFTYTYQGVGTKTIRLLVNGAVSVEKKVDVQAGIPLPPPGDGVVLPVTRHTLTPGTGDQYQHIYSWNAYESASTDKMSGTQSRTIRWGPGGKHSGRVTWVRWATRVMEGSPARWLNFHCHPLDVLGWNASGWDGTYQTGVSPLALDWKEGAVYEPQDGVTGPMGLRFVVQPNERGAFMGSPYGNRKQWSVVSEAEMLALRSQGEWLMVEFEVRWAAANAGGGLRAWRVRGDGQRILVVDAQGINTCWKDQNMVALWEGGGYWNGNRQADGSYRPTLTTGRVVSEAPAAQVGRTREEMLADVPTWVVGWGTGTREPAGNFTYPEAVAV